MGSGSILKQVERSGKSTTEISRLIDEWIFDHRHRKMLKMKLLDGESYEDVAAAFGKSVDQVKVIVKKGIATLKNHL